ncbi:hypothetical protein AB3Y40_05540 [Yoonia sp. R2331]|uniref:hypothetical protein n=1 Tax=Yoonia sp. R2331 TaxID=3237238 RepID=UPI0034E3DA06
MPLQNRVLPDGQIVALSARGTMTGNRGILHNPDRTLGTARWRHKAWICCVLHWQGRKRQVMTGRNWTELFFLDEAVAIAAGHRPCAYCRRAAYLRYREAWTDATGSVPSAPDMDDALHRTRVVPRQHRQITHRAPAADLPNGCFALVADRPHLIRSDHMRAYSPDGYGPKRPRPRTGDMTVMTPAPSIAVLRAGYCPDLHPSAE